MIATIALAIGANATVLSLVNATLMRTVVASKPEQLAVMSATDARTSQLGYIYPETFKAFDAQQRSFSTLSMYSGGLVVRVEYRGTAIDVGVESVTPSYFDLLGATLAAGRFLTADDANLTGGAVAVISERLWRRMCGGDPGIVGETLKVDGISMRVVGVTAGAFLGLQLDAGADLFVPLSVFASERKTPVRAANVIGRLASDVNLKQARAEVLTLWPRIQSATLTSLPVAAQGSVKEQRISIESLATGFSSVRAQWGKAFVVLMGLTAILLAIACVNLTGLTLARALVRQDDLKVCVALGASRARLFRQQLLESLLLSLCGLAAALPVAWWSSHVLTAMLSVARTIPLQRPMTPDSRVVAAAAVVAILMGLVIGLLPAFRAAYREADTMRRSRGVARTLGRSGRLVLVTQVALSMVLLVGAGLFLVMLSRLHANEAPFRDRNILWTRLSRIPGDRARLDQSYFQGLTSQLSQIPGVRTVALSSSFPAYLGYVGALPTDRFARVGATDASTGISGLTEFISPRFFEIFGLSHHGRDFTWQDDADGPAVTIVSESLGKKLFPDGDVIGSRMRVTSGSTSTDLEIVGIAADAPTGNIREPHVPVAYRPMMQNLARAQTPMTHVRVNGDLKSARQEYVRVVESNGRHFVRALFSLDGWIDNALLQERLITAVSTFVATLAVALACVGIYGLLAYAVTSRTREIGVRMALGATRASVVRMIAGEGVMLTVGGVLLGIPCVLGAGTFVRSQLYGVTPTDPLTIVASALVFVVVAAGAATIPALRASRIDPVDALRQE